MINNTTHIYSLAHDMFRSVRYQMIASTLSSLWLREEDSSRTIRQKNYFIRRSHQVFLINHPQSIDNRIKTSLIRQTSQRDSMTRSIDRTNTCSWLVPREQNFSVFSFLTHLFLLSTHYFSLVLLLRCLFHFKSIFVNSSRLTSWLHLSRLQCLLSS